MSKCRMLRNRCSRVRAPHGTLPVDLYAYARETPGPSDNPRPIESDRARIRVTDDWPEVPPITEVELRVIEAHFAEVLDELFGPLP